MLQKIPLLLLSLFFIFQSCNNKEQEEQFAKREQLLLERERLLAQREDSFVMKEAEYADLLQMRDSINALRDSMAVYEWPSEVVGSWSGKLICIESNCSDYAVGDQRIDSWLFESDSTQLVVKIVNKNKVIRQYTAKYDSSSIRMNYKTDAAAKRNVEMFVLLNSISADKIKGTRTVLVDKSCAAKFSVELVRSEK